MNQYYSQSNSEQWQKQKGKDFCSKNKHLFRTMAQSAKMEGSWKSFLCHNDCESINTFTFAFEWEGTDAWRHLAKWACEKSVGNKTDCLFVVVSAEINYFWRILSGKQLQLIFMKLSCISLNQFIHSFAGCVDYIAKFYSIFCWCINKPARYG